MLPLHASRIVHPGGERPGRSSTDNARIELEREVKGLRTAKPEQS